MIYTSNLVGETVFYHAIQVGKILVFQDGPSSFVIYCLTSQHVKKESTISAQQSKYSKGESLNSQSVLQ
jgi:hypothetical protein